MKKIILFLLVLIIGSLAFISCKKHKDIPGPKGDTGAQGPEGSVLQKSGFIETSLSGTNTAGADFTKEGISYMYYMNADDNICYRKDDGEGNETYDIRVKRYDSTGTNFLMFEIKINMEGFADLKFIDFKYVDAKYHFAFLDGEPWYLPYQDTKVTAADFSNYGINFDMNNFNFDPTTGKLSFEFNGVYDEYSNSTGNPASINGSMNINLNMVALKKAHIE